MFEGQGCEREKNACVLMSILMDEFRSRWSRGHLYKTTAPLLADQNYLPPLFSRFLNCLSPAFVQQRSSIRKETHRKPQLPKGITEEGICIKELFPFQFFFLSFKIWDCANVSSRLRFPFCLQKSFMVFLWPPFSSGLPIRGRVLSLLEVRPALTHRLLFIFSSHLRLRGIKFLWRERKA